jgi:hypothetical protein
MSDVRSQFSEIKFLTFAGAGIVGPYMFDGAVLTLLELGFPLNQIKGAIGHSSGTIGSLALCCNYTKEDMMEHIATFDASKLRGERSILWSAYNWAYKSGWYDSSYIREVIGDIIECGINKSDVTFGELKNEFNKELYIITARMYQIENKTYAIPFVFSYLNAANTSVIPIMEASMAIPGYYPYVRLEQQADGLYQRVTKGGDIYFDPAGFPTADPSYIATHELKIPLSQILNFRMQSTRKIPAPDSVERKNIPNFSPGIMFWAVLNKLIHDLRNSRFDQSKEADRTVYLDNKKISITDFNLSAKNKKTLFKSGIEGMHRFFALTPEQKVEVKIPTFNDGGATATYTNYFLLLMTCIGFLRGWQKGSIGNGVMNAVKYYLASDVLSDQINQKITLRR